jgi:archaellum component FlaC
MPSDSATQPQSALLSCLETGTFPSDFPGGAQLRKGRSPRDGYARGWGLEFGGLTPLVLADPLYQECFGLAEGRTIQTSPCRLNLYLLVRYYLPRLGPGAIVEFGSYRGGSAIFMAALCQRLGLQIKVYGLDTFAGMPSTDQAIDAHHAGDFQDTSFEELRNHVTQCGLDPWLAFVPGRFEETAPAVLAASGPVLLAHIDCDIESAVAYSYDVVKPRMAEGGYIVFDDAHSPSCLGATEAVEDLVIRRDGLSCEQISPHFVFRIWPDYPLSQGGPRQEAATIAEDRLRIRELESGLLIALESIARLRQDSAALQQGQTSLRDQLQQHLTLEEQYHALEGRYSQLLEDHNTLRQAHAAVVQERKELHDQLRQHLDLEQQYHDLEKRYSQVAADLSEMRQAHAAVVQERKELHDQLRQHLDLEQQYHDLEKRYSQVAEDNRLLRQDNEAFLQGQKALRDQLQKQLDQEQQYHVLEKRYSQVAEDNRLLRQDNEAFLQGQKALREQLQKQLDQEQQYHALENRYAQALENHSALRQAHEASSQELRELQHQLRQYVELEQAYHSLEKLYSQVLEDHNLLRQQVAMASHSRWCALGRMFGVGPRFG